jgi:hypothetical protein
VSTFQMVYDKALMDSAFRESLSDNPEQTLRSIGVQPTSEILHSIREVLAALKDLQREFGQKFFNDPAIT